VNQARIGWLLLPSVVLVGLSLLVLYGLDTQVFWDQVIFTVVGLGIFLIFGRVDYRIIINYPWLWYCLIILLLVGTSIFGEASRGATRWLNFLGLPFQTSEFTKALIILYGVGLLSRYKRRTIWLFGGYLISLLIPVALVFLQPDLGSSVVILAIGLALVVASSFPVRAYLIGALMISLSLPFMWQGLQSYQRERVVNFFQPAADPLGGGYNAIQSVIAVGSGMVFGRGLGHGTQSQLRFLPERQTDFIFATIAEEFGFIGCVLVVVTIGWLLWVISQIASRSRTFAGRSLALGVFSYLLTQVTINIGMNIGLLPVTGITLPLMSAGGSSLVATFLALGLVASVAREELPVEAKLEIK